MASKRPDSKERLDRLKAIIGQRVEKALTVGAILIAQESAKEVPIDEGPLRASQFIKKSGSGLKTSVEVGYTDPKAVYVHENLTNLHGADFNAVYRKEIAAGRTHKRRPQEKSKFLEDPVKANIDTIQAKVAKEMSRQ